MWHGAVWYDDKWKGEKRKKEKKKRNEKEESERGRWKEKGRVSDRCSAYWRIDNVHYSTACMMSDTAEWANRCSYVIRKKKVYRKCYTEYDVRNCKERNAISKTEHKQKTGYVICYDVQRTCFNSYAETAGHTTSYLPWTIMVGRWRILSICSFSIRYPSLGNHPKKQKRDREIGEMRMRAQ